jgi:capsular exopolysaccharide synthesis family protein
MNKPLPLISMSPLGPTPPPHGPHLDLRKLAQEATPAIVEIWRALRYRKWMILAITLTFTAVALFVALQMKPVYKSTAMVLFDQGRSRVVSIEEVYNGVGAAGRENSTTQLEFLKSRDVSIRVIRKLNLTTLPEFDPRQSSGFSVSGLLASWGIGRPASELTDEEVESIVLDKFQRNLTVEPVRLSQLVKISFESKDRVLAATVANEVAAAFIQADLDARFAVTQQANEWLNQRLGFLKIKLDGAEAALQTYREKQGLVDTRGSAQGGTGKQLEELNQRLVDARVRRTQSEQVYNQVRPGSPNLAQVPAVFSHPSVQRARTAEVEAERRFNEIAQRYGPAYPAYRSAENELRVARETMAREVEAVAASIRKEFEAARASETALEQTLARTRGTVQDINRKEIQQGALEREVEVNKQLYQMFLARQRETTAAADFKISPARVVDPAVPSLVPVAPKVPLIGAGAMVGSLLAAALLTILLARLDNTIKRADDLEQRLGYPLVGAVPKLAGREAAQAHQMMLAAPTSQYAEAIRTVSSGIQLATLDTPHKVVMVTSAVPAEGKSTIASNLALMQSRLRRTLIIDADLRRPTTARRLGLNANVPGLAEYVSGARPIEECAHQLGDSKLFVMPPGQHVPNAAELFATTSFRESIRALSAAFDYIVIDSAPVRPVSDATLLATVSTGVVFVVAADETPAPLARLALKRLGDAGARVFGIVLNRYDTKRAEQYYGDYSSYGDYAEGQSSRAPAPAKV